MKIVIKNHHTNLLSNHTTPLAAHSCSYRQKSEWPLNKKVLSESLIYRSAVSQWNL